MTLSLEELAGLAHLPIRTARQSRTKGAGSALRMPAVRRGYAGGRLSLATSLFW